MPMRDLGSWLVALVGVLLGVVIAFWRKAGDLRRAPMVVKAGEHADDLRESADALESAARAEHEAQDAEDMEAAREAAGEARAALLATGGQRHRSRFAGELGVGEDDP